MIGLGFTHKSQELAKREKTGLYFRITSPEDNLDGNSVETANVTREEAAELFSVPVEEIDDTLEERELYYSDEKKGIYWNGICSTDTIEGMIEYFRLEEGNITAMQDLELVIFEGDWLESCGDGELVQKTKILERIPVKDIDW